MRANGAGEQRSFYAMPYEGRYIWGATAGMLKNMHQRLFRAMIRVVIENILLFLLPTAIYVGYVLLTRSGNTSAGAVVNDAPLVWLFVAGALLVAATLIYYATVTPGGMPGQTYTPPRMGKDGRIEPGQLK